MKSPQFLMLFGFAAFQMAILFGLDHPMKWVLIGLVPFLMGISWTQFKDPLTYEERVFTFFLYLVLMLGPLATYGALISLLWFKHDRLALDAIKKKINEKSISNLDMVRLQLIENPWGDYAQSRIEPLVDIMNGTDLRLKQSAVDKVIQHPSPLSVEVLRIGLKDSSADIRYYAASGLMQLNDMFQKQITNWREKAKQEPKEFDHWFQLGSTYDQFCYWNLPSEDAQEEFLEKAQSCYERALDLKPFHEKLSCSLGRILIKLNKTDRAYHLLHGALTEHPYSTTILSWLAEALYEGKRYSLLQKLAWTYLNTTEIEKKLEEPFSYWAFAFAAQSKE